MASGQQLAKHNLEQFRAWRATQTDEDFLQIIHLGRLKRVEIAKAIGCGKSALTQNPGLRAEIDALESELRNRGILPPVVEATCTPVGQLREYDISATLLSRNDQRSARLELENIELKARVRELERRLVRFGELSETLAEMGMMPR